MIEDRQPSRAPKGDSMRPVIFHGKPDLLLDYRIESVPSAEKHASCHTQDLGTYDEPSLYLAPETVYQ